MNKPTVLFEEDKALKEYCSCSIYDTNRLATPENLKKINSISLRQTWLNLMREVNYLELLIQKQLNQ